jgi:hypothetical protein
LEPYFFIAQRPQDSLIQDLIGFRPGKLLLELNRSGLKPPVSGCIQNIPDKRDVLMINCLAAGHRTPGYRTKSAGDILFQRQCRYRSAVLQGHRRHRVTLIDDMQNHPVIERVLMVSVPPPARGANVNFDIALLKTPTGSDNGVTQIGAAVIIKPAGINDLDRSILFSD